MSWVVHGASRVGSEGAEGLVGLDGTSRASGTTTGEVIGVNWVSNHFAFVTIHTEGSHAHLVHVRATHDDGTSGAQLPDSCRVDRSNEPLEDS